MQEKSILPPSWKVPQEFRNRLGASVGRQRPMVADGHLLLVLHAPPKPEDQTRVGRYFWRTPEGTWTSKDQGSGVSGLNKHLDEYEDKIAALDRQEEAAVTSDAYFEVLESLSPIHRAARNLYRVLQDARKMCPEYRDIIDLRDRAYSIERTADLLYSETKNALDFTVAKRAEEQAQSSHRMAAAAHRLNILAAFFFPIITLTALFGVDFTTMAAMFGFVVPTALVPLAFLGVIICGLVAGAILTSIINHPPSPPNDRGSGKSVHR